MIVRELVTLLSFKTDGASLQRAERRVDALSKRFGRIGKSLTTKVTLPILAIGVASVKSASDVQQLHVAFSTMLGSEEAASNMIKDLTDFAVKTPFTINGVQQSAKQLLAMGISSDKLLPTLKSLGDVSAGLSVPISRIAMNYGQVATLGRLMGRDLKDFAVAGVPIVSELAKMLNVSKSAIGDMVSKGQISFPMVEEAFKRMSSQGGRFANLMDKQSKTIGGMFSNLLDSLIKVARELGFAIIDTIHLGGVLKLLTGAVSGLANWLKDLNPSIRKLIVGLFTLTALLGPVLIGLSLMSKALLLVRSTLRLATGEAIGFQAALFWIPAVIIAIIALLWIFIDDLIVWMHGGDSVLGKVLGSWDNFKNGIVSVMDFIKKYLGLAWEFVLNIFKGSIDFIKALMGPSLVGKIKGGFESMINFIKGLGPKMKEAIVSLFDALKNDPIIKALLWLFNKGKSLAISTGTAAINGARDFANGGGAQAGSDLRGVLGRSIAYAGAQTVTVNSNNEITVPVGTPEEQRQFIDQSVRKVISDENQKVVDAVVRTNSENE